MSESSSIKLCECGCGEPAPIAAYTYRKYGWVKGKPKRFVRGHNNRRFSSEYHAEDRGYDTLCWISHRSTDTSGYPLSREKGRRLKTHRLYYEREHGPIPKPLQLDHLCRQIDCVRPSHCEPVTSAINNQRRPTSVLNAEKVRWARKEYATGNYTYTQLANILGVGYHTIWDALHNRSWKNLG